MFNDLRQFVSRVQDYGECRLVEGVDPNVELGAITDLVSQTPEPPLLMFDRIKGFPSGYRVATNLFTTHGRTAIALGLPKELHGLDLVRAFRDQLRSGIKLVPPVVVDRGPVLENVDRGDKVNVLKFPAPKWHEHDGGPYIGTGTICFTRDPDGGWVNGGTYRIQVHDERTVTANVVPGHHGHIIRQKYWDRGKTCPIAICCGEAPALFAAASAEGTYWGTSELDFAGGLKGSPFEVVKGVTTDLPIPASAELVLEGEWLPPEAGSRVEGPFGEFSGYYAGDKWPLPIIRVNAILYRDDPIILGAPPSFKPSVWTLGRHIQKAASLWEELDKEITGVRGVFMIEEASIHAIPVISLEQQYPGHAMRAAMLALGCGATGFQSSVVIVVDEDIDPSSTADVWWALGTRTDERSFISLPGCWGIRSDPMVPPERDRIGDFEKSRTIILAVKPYHWKDKFPRSIKLSPELTKKTIEKWSHIIYGKQAGGAI